jgi:hypothetical protein
MLVDAQSNTDTAKKPSLLDEMMAELKKRFKPNDKYEKIKEIMAEE